MLTWLVKRLGRPSLVAQLGEEEADRVLDEAISAYRRERGALPHEPSVGGQLMVRLAALTSALYQALVARSVEPKEARRITATVTEVVYRRATEAPGRLARLLRRDPERRLRLAVSAMLWFPFGAPSYRMEHLDAGDDVVAFDVHRCPTADYFRDRDLGELCVESWCNLDYALAERWGARLERPMTLAVGGPCCDFRWHVVREA